MRISDLQKEYDPTYKKSISDLQTMNIWPTNSYIRPSIDEHPTYSRSDQTKVFLIEVQPTYSLTDLHQLKSSWKTTWKVEKYTTYLSPVMIRGLILYLLAKVGSWSSWDVSTLCICVHNVFNDTPQMYSVALKILILQGIPLNMTVKRQLVLHLSPFSRIKDKLTG